MRRACWCCRAPGSSTRQRSKGRHRVPQRVLGVAGTPGGAERCEGMTTVRGARPRRRRFRSFGRWCGRANRDSAYTFIQNATSARSLEARSRAARRARSPASTVSPPVPPVPIPVGAHPPELHAAAAGGLARRPAPRLVVTGHGTARASSVATAAAAEPEHATSWEDEGMGLVESPSIRDLNRRLRRYGRTSEPALADDHDAALAAYVDGLRRAGRIKRVGHVIAANWSLR